MKDTTPDRYLSFLGLDCNGNADRMMAVLAANMETSEFRWVGYFAQKLEEKRRMGTDNLYFVGSQVNALHAFLEGQDDASGLDLLWHLEQNCC